MGEMSESVDYAYLLSQFERAREHKWLKRFVKGVEVIGAENLKELEGRQFVCFSNHKSHFDYIGLAYLFLENISVESFPRFIAGKNLDSRLLAALGLDFRRMGAFFIDRERIARLKRKEKIDYLRRIDEEAVSCLRQGDDFVDFIEGGRNYSGKLLQSTKNGFIHQLLEAEVDPLVIACSVDYDKVVEKDFFPALDFAKTRFRPLYYFLDAFAFLSRPFLREGRGKMYVNFSQPRRLREIVSSQNERKRILELREHVRSQILTGYEEIQKRKTSRGGLEPPTP